MGQTSLRKHEANRRNALASTGPRTPEGKAKVRWNSLQHGLLGQETVIPTGMGQEDHEEFEHLLAALRDDLQPSGALEEILVEKIAVCYWRLRRVLRAENGEIRRDIDDAPRSFRLSLTMQAALAAENSQPSQLRASSYGLDALLEFLNQRQAEVAANKCLSKASLRELAKYFGDAPDGLAARCALAQSSDSNTPVPASESALTTTPATAVESLLRLLEAQKTKLTKALRDVRQDEMERLQSDFDRLAVPKAAEKIVRYEVAMERQLNRALYHLEKMQNRRKLKKQKLLRPFHAKITKQTQTSTSGPMAAPESESAPASPPDPGTAGSG